MLGRLRIAFLVAVIAHCCGQVRTMPHVPVPVSIKMPVDGIAVPMLEMGGKPVVEVKINGKGPFPFVLDTGAAISIVSEDLRRDLSLSPAKDLNLHAVGEGDGALPAMVEIHDIRIGEAVLQGVVAAVMPAGALGAGENVPRGVLSPATFPGYLLTYDYPGKRILMKEGSLEEPDSKRIFQYQDQLLPTVPVRVAGQVTDVDLDTGSPHGLTLPLRFLTQVPLATQPREIAKVHTPGGGEFTVSIARVDGKIEVGKYELSGNQVYFSDIHPGPFPPKGNIGYEVLRDFVVTIDSKNHRIQLER